MTAADTAPELRMDVLTFGEALVSLRSSGPLQTGSTLSASPVGAECNVAIGLARLGHRAQWVGRVGDDPFGRMTLTALRGEGVSTPTLIDPSAPTGLMIVADRRPLPPDVVYYRAGSAGSRLAPADVLAALDDRPRLLHVTGITPALSASAAAAVHTAVDGAIELSIEVSLDVNFRAKLWDIDAAREALTPLARRATVVFGSDDELALVAAGDDASERQADLRAAGVRTVVVKHGSRGAESYGQDGHRQCPAYRVTEVDSIGAGDAFVAGYLSAHLDNLDEAACLDRGCRAGAFAVAVAGDWQGSPSRREIQLLGEGRSEPAR